MIDQKKNDLEELRVWQTLGGWWKVKNRSRANSEMGKGPTVWQTLGQDGGLYIYLCIHVCMYIHKYMYGKKKSVSTYIYAEKGA